MAVASCSYTVPNVEFCATLSDESAVCKETISEKKRRVTQEQWIVERKKRLSIGPDDVGKLLKFIENVCVQSENCVYENIEQFIEDLQDAESTSESNTTL